jgi:hypothetical protein
MTSRRRYATKHAIALGISDWSVRRMLHLDLHFHPYKMMVVQELYRRDLVNRLAFAENLLEIVADDTAIGINDGHTFTYLGVLTNRTSVIGRTAAS